MQRVLIFCGSSPGRLPDYTEAARTIGKELASRRLGLVYGAAQIGVMGATADAVLAAGGEVIGVIPRLLLDKEIAHPGLTELHVVETMHQRKALMESLSDAIIALPGGFGTLEELFEITTWAQLGIHAKPVGLLNVAGYWDPLLAMLDHMVSERFLRAEQRDALLVSDSVTELLDRLAEFKPPVLDKWLDRSRT